MFKLEVKKLEQDHDKILFNTYSVHITFRTYTVYSIHIRALYNDKISDFSRLLCAKQENNRKNQQKIVPI
jgi:hypothetical protein